MSARWVVGRISLSAILLVIAAPAGPSELSAGPSSAPVQATFGSNINLSVSSGSRGANQRETTVAVNPTNPDNMVEGNIDQLPSVGNALVCSFSFTTDGGRTWTFGGAAPTEKSDDVAVDPWLTADGDGNFYYSYMDSPVGCGQSLLGTTDLVVAKSTDGGRTFPTFSIALAEAQVGKDHFSPNKDAIAADAWPASPFRGRVYVAFTNLNYSAGGYQIAVVVSKDGGQTWSRPAILGPLADFSTRGLFGALPVVGPDGSVYVFWADFLFNTGPMSIMFAKSTDGGSKWSKPSAVASNLPSPSFFRLKNSDPKWDTTPQYGIEANSLPTAAVATDGRLYIAWADFPSGRCVNDQTSFEPCENADVRMSLSGDQGKSWSLPVKVSDETGGSDQFYPAIAVHPGGLLSLSWQDKRLDPLNENFDTYYTNTRDGATFLPNVRVSDATSLAGNTATLDFDYNSMAVGPDTIFPVWCDLRTGNGDIYTSVGRLSR